MIDRNFEELLAEEQRKIADAHRHLDGLDERIDKLRDDINHQDAGLIDRNTPSL